MQSVRWMVDLSVRAGVERIVLNGSFVTNIMEPNDVDCVLLIRSDSLIDPSAMQQLELGLPFLEIELVKKSDFDELVGVFFAADRRGVLKGMIEVISWN